MIKQDTVEATKKKPKELQITELIVTLIIMVVLATRLTNKRHHTYMTNTWEPPRMWMWMWTCARTNPSTFTLVYNIKFIWCEYAWSSSSVKNTARHSLYAFIKQKTEEGKKNRFKEAFVCLAHFPFFSVNELRFSF